MLTFPALLAVGAGSSDLEKLRQGFLARPDGGQQLMFWAWVLVFLVIVGLAVAFATRKRKKPEPKIDFLTLAVDLLGLSELDRRTLLRLAGRADIEQPASMLLSPTCLARAAAAVRGSHAIPELDRTIERLSKELFGCPTPATTPPPEPPAPAAAKKDA